MTKTRKFKTVSLLIIFAISIIFIILGATQNGCAGKSEKVYTGTNYITAKKDNCTFTFNPNYSGYYYIHVDNASLINYKKDKNSSTTTLYATSYDEYYGGIYYDYSYKIYLNSSYSYTFTTNSYKGETIEIYITQS